MQGELLRFDLRLRRRMLIGTGLGAAAYLLLVIAVYPTFRNDTSFDTVIAANPTTAAAFGLSGSITSPAGWLNANMYANFGPLLALLLTVGYGASAIAGQDVDGLLGQVATQPMTRARIVAAKAGALWATALVVPVAAYAVCLAGPHFQLTPDWGTLAAVTGAMALLAFDFGALALLVGAVTGSPGAALGVAAGVAAAAYLISSLAPVSSTAHALRWASPFYWAVGNSQLADGISWPQIGALVGLGALLSGAAALAFRRYDVH